MTTITTIDADDQISSSRSDINTNFANLNSDKIETSVIDTDTTLSANSDSKIPSQKAVKAYIDNGGSASYINSLFPTGMIIGFGSATPPTNWLNCDGSAISRTTYATLFAVIGTNYGTGNGSTTFNLPNLKDRFPLGYSETAPTKVFTFVSRASNTITISGASNTALNEIQTGQAVLYSAPSGAMTGLTNNTTYYLIRVAYNQFTLATSVANANAGTVISLSSDGTGTQTFTATYTARQIGEMGGEETHALTDAEMPSHVHPNGASSSGTSRGSGGASISVTDTGSSGSDSVHNNTPLYTVVNYIIKYT